MPRWPVLSAIRSWWRPCLSWLLAGLLPAFILIPALTPPIEEYGLDAACFHIYRGVLFSAARAEAGWYPRWIPELNAGLGGPLLTFYPPLTYFGLDMLQQMGAAAPARVARAGGFERARGVHRHVRPGDGALQARGGGARLRGHLHLQPVLLF